MKTLSSILLLLLLSSALYAKKNYEFDLYNVDRYNQSIPALSLAYTPKSSHGFKFILSYVSTLFQLEKANNEYALNDKYDNLKMSLNFRF
jgi:hypothetical protein